MRALHRVIQIAAICVAQTAWIGCNANSEPITAQSSETAAIGVGGLDRCALLTDSEVRDVLGEFRKDGQTLGNEFGLQGCRWTSTIAQKVQGFPDGWFDSIEATVFEKDREDWARKQARGAPIDVLGSSAVYDDNHGQVWFDCGKGHYCSLRARVNSPSKRRQISRSLALVVRDRVK